MSPEALDGLRRCLRPEYADLPREHLEHVVAASVGGMSPAVTEDFMKTLSSVGAAVAPALQRAAPSIVQGATTGASVGGPWGALIGAGAGLASSALGGAGGAKPPPSAAPRPSAGTGGTGTGAGTTAGRTAAARLHPLRLRRRPRLRCPPASPRPRHCSAC